MCGLLQRGAPCEIPRQNRRDREVDKSKEIEICIDMDSIKKIKDLKKSLSEEIDKEMRGWFVSSRSM